MTPTLLSIRDLVVRYPLRGGFLEPKKWFTAVDGVSLDVRRGEVLGLVGESGCGKSSLAKAAIRLVRAAEGEVRLGSDDFLTLEGNQLRSARSRIQMVFQDPYGSLNPRMSVFDIVAEPLVVHRKLRGKALEDKVFAVFDQVSLPRSAAPKFPHEFSGGQRQRIAIARALVLDPEVLVADEPVSSLDVSVQAQILNLLKDIQRERQLAMIFVSHNLGVVRYLADRVAVMYLGRIVEQGPASSLFDRPVHPYTQTLLASVPVPDPRAPRRIVAARALGEPVKVGSGCAFANRCPLVHDRCRGAVPPLVAFPKEAERVVRCVAAEDSYRSNAVVKEKKSPA